MLLKPKSEKAVSSTKQHRMIRLLAFAAIIVSVVFVIYTIISRKIQIQNYNKRYAEVTEQLSVVEGQIEQKVGILYELGEKFDTHNERIQQMIENLKSTDLRNDLEAYIEEMARDKLDFANGDERIYYVIPSGK